MIVLIPNIINIARNKRFWLGKNPNIIKNGPIKNISINRIYCVFMIIYLFYIK